MLRTALLIFTFCSVSLITANAQKTEPKTAPGPPVQLDAPVDSTSDSVLVTIILKYQQDKSFAELRRRLEAQGFWELFPPAEARVVSWNVAVGFGHIVTLKMRSSAVRQLYLAISNGAWGAFNSEVYMSYEYMPIWQDYMEKRNEAKEERDEN